MAATVTFKYSTGALSGGSGSSSGTVTVLPTTTFLIFTFNGAGSSVNTPTPLLTIGGVSQTLELVTTSTAGTGTRPTLKMYKVTPGYNGTYNVSYGYSVTSGTSAAVSFYTVDGGTVLQTGINTATSNVTNASLPSSPKSDSRVIYARGGTSVSGSITTGGTWTANVNQTAFNISSSVSSPVQTVNSSLSSSQSWATIYVELGEYIPRFDTIGPKPGTTASSSGGTSSWSNVENATSSNNLYATALASSTVANNPYLDVTGFNLGVPSYATIMSIGALIEARSDAPTAIDSVQLLKDGTPVGTALVPTPDWSPTDKEFSFDLLLGGTTWTPAELNSATFGLRFRFKSVSGTVEQTNTQATFASVGGSIPWEDLSNALSTDGTYATQQAPSENTAANAYLRATNLGFNVPADASNISAAGVVYRRRSGGTAGNIVTDTFRPIWNGQSGSSSVQVANWGTTAEAEACVTSAYTASQINSSTFGFEFRAQGVGTTVNSASVFPSIADNEWPPQNITWASTENALTQNSVSASFALPAGDALNIANFSGLCLTGFNTNIPSNATVLGVTASIRRNRTGGTVGNARFAIVQLMKYGVPFSTNQATSTSFPTAIGAVTFGSGTSYWGGAPLTVDEANNLGLYIKVQGDVATSDRIANIDSATLTVRYSVPGDRNAQVEVFAAQVGYTVQQESTVYVDSVAASVNTQGAPKFIVGIDETQGVSASVARQRQVSAEIQESMAYAFGLFVQPNTIAKVFAFNVNEMEQVAVAMARKRGVSMTVAEAEALVVAAMKRGRSMAANVAENETVLTVLGRKRGVATVISETELMSVVLGRIRSSLISIAENEGINIEGIRRVRGLATAINEAETLSISAQFDRVKRMAFFVAETYSASIDTIKRLRRVSVDYNMSEDMAVAVRRLRKVATLVNETETVFAALVRQRGAALNINEVEEISAVLKRLRKMGANVVENENVTIAFGKLKTLAMAFAETETMSVSLSRTIRMALLISSIEEVSAELLRKRGFVPTVVEKEEIKVLLERVRGVACSISEFEYVTSTLSRIRDVGFGWDETQSVGMFLGRLKVMSAIILQSMDMQVNAVQRVRGLASAIPEQASYLAALERVRNMGTVITSEEGLQINFGRVRGLMSEIVETQGVTAGSLRRLRGFASDIAETYGCDIRLTVFRIGNEKLVMTAMFEQWVAKPDGTLDLQTKTMSWEVQVTPKVVVLDIPVNKTVVIDVVYEPMPTPELDDLMSSGIKI